MEASGQLHALANLLPKKESAVRMGGPQNRSGCGGEEKKIPDLAGTGTPDRPVRSQSLSRLSYRGSSYFPLSFIKYHM
jgi:hypothetical protein